MRLTYTGVAIKIGEFWKFFIHFGRIFYTFQSFTTEMNLFRGGLNPETRPRYTHAHLYMLIAMM